MTDMDYFLNITWMGQDSSSDQYLAGTVDGYYFGMDFDFLHTHTKSKIETYGLHIKADINKMRCRKATVIKNKIWSRSNIYFSFAD